MDNTKFLEIIASIGVEPEKPAYTGYEYFDAVFDYPAGYPSDFLLFAWKNGYFRVETNHHSLLTPSWFEAVTKARELLNV